jgi:hypothetical protein
MNRRNVGFLREHQAQRIEINQPFAKPRVGDPVRLDFDHRGAHSHGLSVTTGSTSLILAKKPICRTNSMASGLDLLTTSLTRCVARSRVPSGGEVEGRGQSFDEMFGAEIDGSSSPSLLNSRINLANTRFGRRKSDRRLWPLWLHPVRSLEVFSRVGDELRVAWMIDGLHADNGAHQLGTVVVNMLDQFGLCIGWPNDEDRACICDGIRDRLQIDVILRHMPAADRICFAVNVPGWMIGM